MDNNFDLLMTTANGQFGDQENLIIKQKLARILMTVKHLRMTNP